MEPCDGIVPMSLEIGLRRGRFYMIQATRPYLPRYIRTEFPSMRRISGGRLVVRNDFPN